MTICLWWSSVLGITGMSQFSYFNWNLSLLVFRLLVDFLIQNLGFFVVELRCSHYRRRCKIRAPCCNEIFDCRHCHNEAKVYIHVNIYISIPFFLFGCVIVKIYILILKLILFNYTWAEFFGHWSSWTTWSSTPGSCEGQKLPFSFLFFSFFPLCIWISIELMGTFFWKLLLWLIWCCLSGSWLET